jgi:hypothetical protein
VVLLSLAATAGREKKHKHTYLPDPSAAEKESFIPGDRGGGGERSLQPEKLAAKPPPSTDPDPAQKDPDPTPNQRHKAENPKPTTKT